MAGRRASTSPSSRRLASRSTEAAGASERHTTGHPRSVRRVRFERGRGARDHRGGEATIAAAGPGIAGGPPADGQQAQARSLRERSHDGHRDRGRGGIRGDGGECAPLALETCGCGQSPWARARRSDAAPRHRALRRRRPRRRSAKRRRAQGRHRPGRSHGSPSSSPRCIAIATSERWWRCCTRAASIAVPEGFWWRLVRRPKHWLERAR